MYEEVDPIERQVLSRRVAVYSGIIVAVFIVLAVRLYYLQVVRGPEFERLSENNRVSLVRLRPPRGNICDRYGNVLVTNRQSFSVNLVLENVRDLPGTIAMLSRVLGMEEGELKTRVGGTKSHRKFEPIRVREDISRREVAVIESSKYEWPGVQIEVEFRRSYPFGKLAAHLLGQLGQIDQEELSRRRS